MSAAIVHGGGIAAAATLYGGRPEDWLDLSTGINPCPPELPDIPARAWHRLPDRELEAAARLAAKGFYQSGERLPLPVPGTQSAIQLLPRLADPAKRVAIVSPTYGEYGRVFAQAGFAVDAVTSLEEIDTRHGLVVVANPNNPTGRTFSSADLAALAARLQPSGGWLVVDEAFGDIAPLASMAGRTDANLIVLRSFGKFFGMAGIRLGFVIADDSVTARLADWLGPWAVSGPALAIATALFSADRQPIHARIIERCAALQQILGGARLRIAGGAGLFALVEDPDAAALHAHLCAAHILTRRFDYAPTWLRFGLAPDDEGDARLAAALDDWRQRQR
ncbi:threonine-phosphate decarboxylase [Agrobacterium sp. a22-2]|uniref:threonine-phosphate decarboxylase CobD n=1 Tax=Agrobacterium sp. a22-2 TaxID=2283840 RepID=UPI0014466E2F|nr:threonine-phosphate decarboxylase CobD [Agrobacterium sp. a22-2]NKN37846.1 threonine-phosphate decarboxylase [Agrobacterium sp. a22-2]